MLILIASKAKSSYDLFVRNSFICVCTDVSLSLSGLYLLSLSLSLSLCECVRACVCARARVRVYICECVWCAFLFLFKVLFYFSLATKSIRAGCKKVAFYHPQPTVNEHQKNQRELFPGPSGYFPDSA